MLLKFQAIVYQWNLWYIDFDVATPELKQITFDGEENKIYNAIPDWMYEGRLNYCFYLTILFKII